MLLISRDCRDKQSIGVIAIAKYLPLTVVKQFVVGIDLREDANCHGYAQQHCNEWDARCDEAPHVDVVPY